MEQHTHPRVPTLVNTPFNHDSYAKNRSMFGTRHHRGAALYNTTPCAANRRPGRVLPHIGGGAAQNRYIPATNTTPENSSVVTQ